jgi:hypothetical protein
MRKSILDQARPFDRGMFEAALVAAPHEATFPVCPVLCSDCLLVKGSHRLISSLKDFAIGTLPSAPSPRAREPVEAMRISIDLKRLNASFEKSTFTFPRTTRI